ncbi:ATP-binding protein [Chitinophaga sp. 30R24]|uniref:ATP-binding protein n=1 Tax=Chitinophaga sp. 30R24 TaxID=3248838 RepID=UPI003B8FD5D5
MLATTFTSSLKSDSVRKEIQEGMSLHDLILQQQRLLEIIASVHDLFADRAYPQQAFKRLLNDLQALTGSEYGFIGEVVPQGNSIPQLLPLAINNFAEDSSWSFATSLQTVAHSGQPLIRNMGSTTAEHLSAPSFSFLGLPVIHHQKVLMVIGLAGYHTTYSTTTLSLLQPLLQALGGLHFREIKDRSTDQLLKDYTSLQSELESLILTLDDIVFEMDEKKVFTRVWCNQESLLFRPREEVIGKNISEVLGEHALAFNRMADKILHTGEPQEYIYPDIRQDDQRWYELKMRLIINKTAAPRRILLLIKNVSEREKRYSSYLQSQSELRRSNQLLSICQQMGKMGGWEFNVTTGETYWTQEVYTLREVPSNFPISLPSSINFYHPGDQPTFITAVHQLREEKIPYDLELRHISAKGTHTWVRTVGRPIYNSHGHLTHFRGIIMDITDKKDAELELLKARDHAQKAAQSRSDFLSVMSHEIRTPLNAIIGIAGILQSMSGPEHIDVVHNLQFSANHLLGLINDILDFSKMEAGKVELEHIPFAPAALFQGIVRNYLPLAEAKGITLYTQIDHNIPPIINGDPVRLSQILNNLLNNAIKFTPTGSVTLEVARQNLAGPRCILSFAVKDTGIGIVPDMQEKVFDTFVQEDTATTRHYGGTGLGLAITKKLIHLYNSNITVESKKNEGTVFRFNINFAIPEKDNRHLAQEEKYADGCLEGMKLLVVEDNAINIRILELQLKRTGATTVTARNGHQALARLQEQEFDAVILDLHMPEMNGYETIPHIQHLQPDAFIVVLTADIMPEVRERLSRLHIKDLLPKPYAAHDLLTILKKQHSRKPMRMV